MCKYVHVGAQKSLHCLLNLSGINDMTNVSGTGNVGIEMVQCDEGCFASN